ncbi:MAG: DUF349 domain-containing protein [Pseudomonadales bacterium]|nr:DUF349 domain-containing protein [Pseudomonadales bacterium]
MFKKLFKPKWQSAKPHVRIQAVAQLNAADTDDLHIIELLAKNDVEPDVRFAAVQKIFDQEKLISVIQQEKHPETRIKMIEQLLSTIDADAGINAWVEKLIQGLDGQALTTIIETTKNATLGLLALQGISDEGVLKNYALNLPLAALRQQAVEKVESEELLEEIEKASKGKDKSVFRIARNKLQGIRENLKKEENLEQQIANVCLNMEQLARGSEDPMYQSKVEHWQKQWTRVEMHASADDSQRFNRAYEICRQVISEAAQEENAQKAQAQKKRAALQERMAACEQLETALAQLKAAEAIKSEDVPALSALLKTQQNRWEEAAAESSPASDERKRFNRSFATLEKALSAIQLLNERSERLKSAALALLEVDDASLQQLQGLKKALDNAAIGIEWPEEVPVPDVLQLMEKAVQSHEMLRKKAQQKENEAIGNLKELLTKLDEAITAGSLKPANKYLADAQKWAKHIPIKSVQKYQKELRQYSARVNELRDWQGYAITPKKEQLCNDMEALVSVAMDPQELANRIKRLQDEWKQLGHSRDSQALWQRFSDAAEKAYDPCRDYFENLAGIRQKNLAARKNIVAQLTDYLEKFNFEGADWAAVNQVYEAAKQEWRSYNPVERKEGKEVQDQFNGLLDSLRGKLNDEWNRNKQKREDLIAKADALIEEPDLQKAIEEAKSLQRQWKDTGLVARRDENKLWKRFRSACDKIFERRDEERQAAQLEREKNTSEANHLIELIEHLADADNLSLEESQKEFRELQQRFTNLGTIPKEQYDDIQKRYRAVCDLFVDGIRVAQVAARKDQVARLWQTIMELDELEASCLNDAQAALPGDEIVLDYAVNDREVISLADRYAVIRDLAENTAKPNVQEIEDNTTQLHNLCIQLEIVGGVDSPSEDQQTRMQLQVSRLSNGLGQREQGAAVSDQVAKLQRQWCAVGPAQSDMRSKYTQRFTSVLKQIGEL